VLRALAYIAGAVAVTVLVHAYLERRLVHATDLAEPWRKRARIATWAASLLLPAGMIGLLTMRDAPRSLQAPIMWSAFTWVGLLAFLLPLLVIGHVATIARQVPADPSRRRAIARIVAVVSGGASVVLGAASTAIAHLPLQSRRVRVSLAKLPSELRGYRIAQISDVHVSATIGRELVDELVARVNELSPDLIAITGDLVDGSVKELGPLVAPLAALRARDGVWFVTGNHEYLSGAEEWLAHLATLGVRVLRNERVAIRGFDLVGIDDPSGSRWLEGHGSDLARALASRDESRPAILLAHRPDHVDEASRAGVALQLSGHTHGGQIAPVGWTLERLHQPYVCGLYRVSRTALYVTSGAGFWGPPMRLGTRAEIALIELDNTA
jgi:predicted MPP superfamily phosphohydrolase